MAGQEKGRFFCPEAWRAQTALCVLVDEGFGCVYVSLPAGTRTALGIDSVNDVATVERKEPHILRRSADLQLAALLGTAIAIFRLDLGLPLQIAVCAILFSIVFWAALNEERVKAR